jgi:hypothetical protein
MRKEVHADEGICDVGHYEPLREIPAYTQGEAERQPSLGVDGSAISCTEVIVDPFPASQNEPAVVDAKVRTSINQELPLTKSIHNEEAACHYRGDMCRR